MTKAETFMIVDAHRQDPMQRVTCELLSAIFPRSGSIETIGTADHSVKLRKRSSVSHRFFPIYPQDDPESAKCKRSWRSAAGFSAHIEKINE